MSTRTTASAKSTSTRTATSGTKSKCDNSQRNLRPKKEVNYKTLHTEQQIKKHYKSLRRRAQPMVTKLAPGAFSPKGPPPASGQKPSTT
jgi:hypothetical protein